MLLIGEIFVLIKAWNQTWKAWSLASSIAVMRIYFAAGLMAKPSITLDDMVNFSLLLSAIVWPHQFSWSGVTQLAMTSLLLTDGPLIVALIVMTIHSRAEKLSAEATSVQGGEVLQ